MGASVETSEEEEDVLLLVRSWTRGLEMCVKFGALFGSAPEVVAEGLENIVKEMNGVEERDLFLFGPRIGHFEEIGGG